MQNLATWENSASPVQKHYPAESFSVIQKHFWSSNYTLGAKITLRISLQSVIALELHKRFWMIKETLRRPTF